MALIGMLTLAPSLPRNKQILWVSRLKALSRVGTAAVEL